MQRRFWPALPLVLLLLGIAVAGCTSPANDNGATETPSPTPGEDPLWSNPYSFELHFDGERAYADLLAQIYEDPENLEGPRYRIPGTETHADVAEELFALLEGPMEEVGGEVSFHEFSGDEYFELDLEPVKNYAVGCDDDAETRVRGLEFKNIVARTNSSDLGILIGAHWDTKRFADSDPDHPDEPVLGADDGASGTAAVVELARAFATTPIDLPVTFILFDGEDGFEPRDCHPLAGSLHFAQSLSEAEKETIHGLILLDMVGNETAQFRREGHSEQGFPFGSADAVKSKWLVNHVWNTSEMMGVEAFINGSTGALLDDHIPFLHQEIHAIDIIRYEKRFPPYWHTTRDDHTAVQPDGLEQVGVVVEASIRLFDEDPALLDPPQAE